MFRRFVFAAVSASILVVASAAVGQSASELLEKGIYTEETVGDLEAAIKIYQKILADAEAARPFVAQAQYRLGQCLLKQGKKDEATAAFEKLIKDYPDQEELVAKAKKHVPGKPELELGPVPWVDGEFLQLAVKLGGGLDIGDFIWAVESDKIDGRDAWRTKVGRYIRAGVPSQGVSWVIVDRDTFQPIKSVFEHTLLGHIEAEYAPGKVTVRSKGTDGKESVRTVDLDGVWYDNEQGMHVFRRLPLKQGYKATMPIYATIGAGKIEVEVEVTAKETVEVPAGKFQCYKLHLPVLQQTFWLSADEHRYLVKLEAGGITGELETIRQDKPGKQVEYQNDKLGFSIAGPSGWFFGDEERTDEKPKTSVFILDPEADGFSVLQVQKLENLEPEQRASARAWADNEIVEAKKKGFKQYEVRPDSWHERTLSGQPAVSFIADYMTGERKMVEYSVYTLGKSTAAAFSTKVEPERFEGFKPKFDAVVDSYRTK